VSEYPAVVIHDGEVRLADRTSQWRSGGVELVDAEHRPTGTRVPRAATEEVTVAWPRARRLGLGFCAPRWHRGIDTAWLPPHVLYLAHDGRAFLRRIDTAFAPVLPIGKGEEQVSFAAGARLYQEHDDVSRSVVVYEARAGRAYSYDAAAQHFVPLELPDGDRLLDVRHVRARTDATSGYDLALVGERGHYVTRGDALVRSTTDLRESKPRPPIAAAVTGGPMVATVALAADRGRPAFAHEFRPRTWTEQAFAALASALAAVQPFAFHLDCRSGRIVLLALGIGALCAWLAARRLHRIGAPSGVRRYWGVACLCAGPAALPLCVLVERRSAHAARPRSAPTVPLVSTPVTPVRPESVLAKEVP
jgi:hypothetical protein